MHLPAWNRKRVAAWSGAIVLSIWIPVAIDQAYFRYNAYILPVVGLIASILYLGLVFTSPRATQQLHSLHGSFLDRPLTYALIVGSFVGLLILLVGTGEWTAIQASKAHVAELRVKDNPPAITPPKAPSVDKPPATPIAREAKQRTATWTPKTAATTNPPKDSEKTGVNQGTATGPVTVQSGVVSIGQQGGQTAETIINNPPAPEKTWNLSVAKCDEWMSKLDAFGPTQISVGAFISNNDGNRVASILGTCFRRSKNWKVQMTLFPSNADGVELGASRSDKKLEELESFLGDAGLRVSASKDIRPEYMDGMDIVVGVNPIKQPR